MILISCSRQVDDAADLEHDDARARRFPAPRRTSRVPLAASVVTRMILPPRPPGVCAAAPCAPGTRADRRLLRAAPHSLGRIAKDGCAVSSQITSLVGPRIVNDTGFLYTIPEENIASGPVHLQSPTPSPSDVAGIAEQFTSARLAARSLREYPVTVPCDLEDRLSLPETSRSRAGRSRRRLESRAHRSSSADQVMPKSASIRQFFAPNVHIAAPRRGIDCRVEGGRLQSKRSRDLRRPRRVAASWNGTIDEAATSSASCAIGIEIASSPLATLDDLGPGAVVSDFGD